MSDTPSRTSRLRIVHAYTSYIPRASSRSRNYFVNFTIAGGACGVAGDGLDGNESNNVKRPYDFFF